jgi:aspartate aminotransferase
VAILPGAAFQRPAEELTARFAYVGFDGAKALAASETLALDQALPDDFLEYWCGEVIEATERIVEWVTAPRGSVVTIL